MKQSSPKIRSEREIIEKRLSDNAEKWAREHNIPIPPRDTEQWGEMFSQWIDFAFDSF